MPLIQSPYPLSTAFGRAAHRRTGRIDLAPVLTGAAGAVLLLALAAAGRAEAPSSGLAAALLAVLGVGLGLYARAGGQAGGGQAGGAQAGGAQAGAAPLAEPPAWEEARTYADALELAPNPMLIVRGAEADDLAGRRIAFANASARELLRVPAQGALLLSAVRNPDLLEAVDESLFGRVERVIAYEAGGPQNRFWRVWTKPLPGGEDERLALVVLRDETDILHNERMRADFLANASHELRTPLASLSGFIETLAGHAKDDEAARARFLAIMARQAERMSRLIDDLLSLSRIELNEHIRPSGTCDLALVVADVADALAPQIAAKAIALQIRAPEAGRAVAAGDRDQIVQVLQNLLDNAVKYSPPAGVVGVLVTPGLTLDAALALQPDGGRLAAPDGGRMPLLTPSRSETERYILVQVSDRGPGMAREHLPRLTERFYRVEGQKSGERMGTGLGLAIVKHIVNRHRGGFVVESAPREGAAFTVYLPMPAAPGGPGAAR